LYTYVSYLVTLAYFAGSKENIAGRIGPLEVVFDFRSNGGSGIVAVESHRLEVNHSPSGCILT